MYPLQRQNATTSYCGSTLMQAVYLVAPSDTPGAADTFLPQKAFPGWAVRQGLASLEADGSRRRLPPGAGKAMQA